MHIHIHMLVSNIFRRCWSPMFSVYFSNFLSECGAIRISECLQFVGVSVTLLIRRHQTCAFRECATSAAAELGGEIHNVSPGLRRFTFYAGPSTGTEVARLAPSGFQVTVLDPVGKAER